jgi:hypothetical protein
MLVLNRLLLNREYVYSNKCSEGLGFDHFYVKSPCNFLIEDYAKIFCPIYKRNISSIQCKMGLRRSTTARKINPLSVIFINFNIPAFTPELYLAETTL